MGAAEMPEGRGMAEGRLTVDSPAEPGSSIESRREKKDLTQRAPRTQRAQSGDGDGPEGDGGGGLKGEGGRDWHWGQGLGGSRSCRARRVGDRFRHADDAAR